MDDAADLARRPDRLAAAREQFLCTEQPDTDAVRHTILASWSRSRTWNVAADRIDLRYVQDPDLETPLIQTAAPVLDHLQEQLSDLAVSVILTDAKALVLNRRTEDSGLERYLDRVHLAPGFSYAEEFVGTNGIGTALEGRQPTAVFGHEHYAEKLDMLGCAGVPIRHPVSGQVVGLLDLTCWRKEAGPLLMTLAKATARDIEKELTTQVGIRELSLFSEYLRACRRGKWIVVAVSNDLVMLNEPARQLLDPEDQKVLVTQAAELRSVRRKHTSMMDLPSGAHARVSWTPVLSDAGPAGGVVRARLLHKAATAPSSATIRPPALPGVVGSGMLWSRACGSLGDLAAEHQWAVVHGEAGSGKLAIIRAVHARNRPTASFVVVGLADQKPAEWMPVVRQALRDERVTLVLRHVDQLSAQQCRELGLALEAGQAQSRPGLWVVATATGGGPAVPGTLLRHFPASVSVPPLRHHIEDVRELVPYFLVKLGRGARMTCSSSAMHLLLRMNWPGNIAQLREVLQKVVASLRAGTVEPHHLPPECRSTSSRVLNPLESMERDAIVRSLLEAGGNKTEAARALGMSRATIYRKIRDYGIDSPG